MATVARRKIFVGKTVVVDGKRQGAVVQSRGDEYLVIFNCETGQQEWVGQARVREGRANDIK